MSTPVATFFNGTSDAVINSINRLVEDPDLILLDLTCPNGFPTKAAAQDVYITYLTGVANGDVLFFDARDEGVPPGTDAADRLTARLRRLVEDEGAQILRMFAPAGYSGPVWVSYMQK